MQSEFDASEVAHVVHSRDGKETSTKARQNVAESVVLPHRCYRADMSPQCGSVLGHEEKVRVFWIAD